MNQESENVKKLKAFFDTEYQVLKSYVGSKIKQSIHQDPEDIIQDVALKLFASASGYSSINNVAGFVYRSLKNRIIDGFRKNKSSKYDEDINEAKLMELTELIYGKPDNEYSEMAKEELKMAIENLKPMYRDIIVAIDFEEYTYKELAEELNIPIGTLMSRRHRALGLLLKKIKKEKTIQNEFI